VAETPYTRRLRVALVDPSGYTRPYDHELARALARRGHDVSLWTASFVHGDPPPPEGYRVHELFYRRTNRLGGPQAVRRLAKAGEHLAGLWELRGRLRAEGVDVVHVQWAVLRPVERTFYTRLQRDGTPVVFTAHDPIPNMGGDRRRRSVAATARVFERVIVHSEWGRTALVERCGVAEERVRVIPHGVFGYLAELPAVAPPADPPGPMALLPGLIRPYKGTDVLLAAWPRVRAAVPTAELVIAGRPMMDVSTLRLDQPGVTVIPRFVSDAELAALLRRADVVALPYRSIDNSGVVFSALALGAGVVLSNVGGFRELHERDGVGALVPPGDPAALAATVIEVLTSTTRRDALRAASRTAAEGRLSWGEIAEATESVYREVV
jgi:glycosyltransferase involved in cell wall biosynthesis